MDKHDVHRKQKEYLFPNVATFYEDPLVLVRGEGQYLWDSEGRQYLDFFGGILTVSVGHCNPKVNARVLEQNQILQHTSTLYETIPQVELAEKLAQITPGRLQKSFFTNSGTEANETAVLIAQLYTGSQEIIALRHGYSGRSVLARTLTAHSGYRNVSTQLPFVKHAHNAYCYRCPFAMTYPACDLRCAKDIEELIQTETSGQVAALLAEPIQGVGGFITPPDEYFKEAVAIVRNYGGLFICDEVQTGWGRTGTFMFGIEHWGVAPEIMTSAKGMANGLPIGWTIAHPEVADAYRKATISTFGGNPVTCTAALATISVIEEERLAQHAEATGRILKDGLLALQQKYPCMGDVRGKGLMLAVEFVHEGKRPAADIVKRLFEATKERNLLIGKGGLYGNVVRITPALTVTPAEVHEALRILDEALAEVTATVVTG